MDAILDSLAERIGNGRIIAVTGAGMSTASGLPDYRGTGSTQIPPVDYDMIVSDPVWQKWLWYCSELTWKAMLNIRPNAAHLALAHLEASGILIGVATQNIDGLDRLAGIKNLWELHGNYRFVDCLGCQERYSREDVSQWLTELNPQLEPDLNPDNIAIVPVSDREAAESCDFRQAMCPRCGGILKPAIVMFGESLPYEELSGACQAAQTADVILIAGTSLAVNTPMSVVSQALANDALVVVINQGPTAIDRYADVRLDARVEEALPLLAHKLT
ncbi:Sir2 family NAD-dependent protein deacetylase [Schaalia sp. ZJ1691]|uniref:SIR2 family NAD-dependent protein deacylase n=1 Tax=Schaalia sp. ZJ1691 TaxID=2709404 RepID=UPI0013E9D508|nr:Sir2 family NAD-dependent protein deacetylase [Schaalia sp. ZJ1691]